jgi:hypothetical protein
LACLGHSCIIYTLLTIIYYYNIHVKYSPMKTNGDKKQYAHPFSLTQEHIAKNTYTIHNRFNSATMFVSVLIQDRDFFQCAVFFMFNELRWEVSLHFVDIGGIVDHYWLSFLWIIHILNTIWLKVTRQQQVPRGDRCLMTCWYCIHRYVHSVVKMCGVYHRSFL